MVKHIVDMDKCRGCGKCIEECGLELWELIDIEDGQKRPVVVPSFRIETKPETCEDAGECLHHK